MSAAPDYMASATKYRAFQQEYPREFFVPYSYQRKWRDATADNKQMLQMAANQIGKTIGTAHDIACWLTGDYPDDWNGLRLDYGPLIWGMGVSGENIRDNLQLQLFGELITGGRDSTFLPGGMVHPSEVAKVLPATGTRGLAKNVSVRHKSGRISTLSLKSYSQGQHALMGPKPDIIWIDEEPEDPEIYPQCVIRTTNSNQGAGGLVLMTFTPENGMTQLVQQFMNELGSSQFLQNATWDDAPHITADRREQLLEAIPEYQRDMRSKGIPVLGSGMVFPVAEERIKCDPFAIPKHYKRIAAIDFGIDHPTACAWLAYDADTDVIYVYDTYREKDRNVPVHASAIRARGDMPLVYPHDGESRDKGSGVALIKTYEAESIKRTIRFSNPPDREHPKGTIFVEPGILDILTRMQTGRFKVFSNQKEWFDEFRLYHRHNGQIVKVFDDLMSATRYGAIMVPTHGVQGHRRAKAQPYQAMAGAAF